MFSLPAHIFDAYPVVVASIKKSPLKERDGSGKRERERESGGDELFVKGTLRPYFGRELRIMRVLRAHRHKYIRGGGSGLAASGGRERGALLPPKCERKLR